MLHNYAVYVKIMYWTRYLLERIEKVYIFVIKGELTPFP